MALHGRIEPYLLFSFFGFFGVWQLFLFVGVFKMQSGETLKKKKLFSFSSCFGSISVEFSFLDTWQFPPCSSTIEVKYLFSQQAML